MGLSQILKRSFIVVFSIGWILPGWMGLLNFLEFFRIEIAPLLQGQPTLNSFPLIDFSMRCFSLSAVWLTLALGYWIWILSGHPKPKHSGLAE